MYNYNVVSFNLVDKAWALIRLTERPGAYEPQYNHDWNLTGYDGKVVLVDSKDLTLWRLIEMNEENAYAWSEL